MYWLHTSLLSVTLLHYPLVKGGFSDMSPADGMLLAYPICDARPRVMYAQRGRTERRPLSY